MTFAYIITKNGFESLLGDAKLIMSSLVDSPLFEFTIYGVINLIFGHRLLVLPYQDVILVTKFLNH